MKLDNPIEITQGIATSLEVLKKNLLLYPLNNHPAIFIINDFIIENRMIPQKSKWFNKTAITKKCILLTDLELLVWNDKGNFWGISTCQENMKLLILNLDFYKAKEYWNNIHLAIKKLGYEIIKMKESDTKTNDIIA